MYNDYSIAISSTKNILRIKHEFNFIEHVRLTSQLSAIPFTDSFLNAYPSVFPRKSPIKELEDTRYDDLYFLLDYSDIPIILYEISYHHDLGGKGDEAWLFADHKLSIRYFEETAPTGMVLNKALVDSKLDLGQIPREFNCIYFEVERISFRTLGFGFKKNPEDFFK